MKRVKAARLLAVGDVLAGRAITAIYDGPRYVVVAPHGWRYAHLDSVALDTGAGL